jgi:ABC-type multidrug transport system ATPase subunit
LETILSTENLTKHYGRLKAVDNLSLTIKSGTVFGILGPNGSGKTTTLGMILDVIKSTSGSYKWFNEEPTKQQRMRIGAILETPIFYPYLTGAKNLEIVCEIKGIAKERIDVVLQQVGLFERRDDKFRTYSLGMKQRLSIASALLCDPEVMILDEPTNGLDPQGIADIRELIISIAKAGKTIVLASHLLDEVQKVCSDFCVLKSGKLVYSGNVSDVTKGEIAVEVKSTEDLEPILSECAMVKSFIKQIDTYEVKLNDGFHAQELNQYCFDKGISLSHLVSLHKSLEKQFLEILKESA